MSEPNHDAIVLFSNECERGLLSAILHRPVEMLEQAQELPEGVFYFEANSAMFELLLEMRRANIAIEPVSLTSFARDHGKLQLIGAEQGVNELYSHRPNQRYVEFYMQTLREKRGMRELKDFAERTLTRIFTAGADPVATVELTQQEAMKISLERIGREPRHVLQVLNEIDEDLRASIARGGKIAGLQTGLVRLDEATNGIERGERRILVGLSNVGKTWRATQMIKALLNQGQRLIYFMHDGKDKEVVVRLYADIAGVELGFLLGNRFTTDDHAARWALLNEAKKKLEKAGLFIDDQAHSIEECNAIQRRMVVKQGINGAFHDYFGRMTSIGFKSSDKYAMLTSVAEGWARGIDAFDGNFYGVMLQQAAENEFSVGVPIDKGPASVKECKNLYNVATKGEGLSREMRAFEELKKNETKICDMDRYRAPELEPGEQVIRIGVIKSKTSALPDIWARLKGNMGRMSDFYPKAEFAEPRSRAHDRLAQQIAAGSINWSNKAEVERLGLKPGRPRKDGSAPPPEDDLPEPDPEPTPEPPKRSIGQGPSLCGPLSITRPNRPNQTLTKSV